jgi:hypothetical protein
MSNNWWFIPKSHDAFGLLAEGSSSTAVRDGDGGSGSYVGTPYFTWTEWNLRRPTELEMIKKEDPDG